jgi:hypothetical protein
MRKRVDGNNGSKKKFCGSRRENGETKVERMFTDGVCCELLMVLTWQDGILRDSKSFGGIWIEKFGETCESLRAVENDGYEMKSQQTNRDLSSQGNFS